jgi:hypothetical protein
VKRSRYFLGFLLTVYSIACTKEDEGLSNEQIFADFEYAWHVADTTYPYMELKRINWDSIYNIYYERVQSTNIRDHLILIHDLLGELKDGYVYYYDKNNNMVYVYVPRKIQKDENAVSMDVIRSYFKVATKLSDSGKIEYEILPR